MPMSNYTFEDYKKAIKAKYEEELEGEYSNNLSSPTTANLRKLCVKRFESNNNRDDLTAFEAFFDIPFDQNKKNFFGDDEMNKLEAVKRFFLGKTENPAEDTIQLAAILVDLQPRPFREFRKQIDEEDLKIFNDLTDTNFSNSNVSADNLNNELENLNVSKNEEEPEQTQDSEIIESEEPEITSIRVSNFGSIGKKHKPKIWRNLVIGAALIGLSIIIYSKFSKKQCMQWSQDHYELVDCNFKAEGFAFTNPVELLDESLVNLKKVEVCDTTRCFDKNGDAIVWYAKTANGIDFFDGHGRHPENNSPLRPVTQYILNKYVKKR